jgi:hypothetical protein
VPCAERRRCAGDMAPSAMMALAGVTVAAAASPTDPGPVGRCLADRNQLHPRPVMAPTGRAGRACARCVLGTAPRR